MTRDLFLLLRPKQWTKNLFVFMPLFFSLHLNDPARDIAVTFAFIAFCMVASSVYIFNDIIDIEEDRQHPKKKFRPLASEKVSRGSAISLMAGLLMAGSVTAWLLSPHMLYLCMFYILLNVAYSIKLKHIPILDIMIIAAGFVIRIFVGGVVGDIPIYMWIVIMTFLLALFLALGKRRDDVQIFIMTNHKPRKSAESYNLAFIDASMTIMAAVVIVAYLMYATSPEIMEKFKTDKIYLTTIFVLTGIMRYLQITMVKKTSGSPTEILLKDSFIQLSLAGWILSFGLLLYL